MKDEKETKYYYPGNNIEGTEVVKKLRTWFKGFKTNFVASGSGEPTVDIHYDINGIHIEMRLFIDYPDRETTRSSTDGEVFFAFMKIPEKRMELVIENEEELKQLINELEKAYNEKLKKISPE